MTQSSKVYNTFTPVVNATLSQGPFLNSERKQFANFQRNLSVPSANEEATKQRLEVALELGGNDLRPRGFRNTLADSWAKFREPFAKDKALDSLATLIFSKKFFLKETKSNRAGEPTVKKSAFEPNAECGSVDLSELKESTKPSFSQDSSGASDNSYDDGDVSEKTAPIDSMIQSLEILQTFARKPDDVEFNQVIYDHIHDLEWKERKEAAIAAKRLDSSETFDFEDEPSLEVQLELGSGFPYADVAPLLFSSGWNFEGTSDVPSPALTGSAILAQVLGIEKIHMTKEAVYFINNVTSGSAKAVSAVLAKVDSAGGADVFNLGFSHSARARNIAKMDSFSHKYIEMISDLDLDLVGNAFGGESALSASSELFYQPKLVSEVFCRPLMLVKTKPSKAKKAMLVEINEEGVIEPQEAQVVDYDSDMSCDEIDSAYTGLSHRPDCSTGGSMVSPGLEMYSFYEINLATELCG